MNKSDVAVRFGLECLEARALLSTTLAGWTTLDKLPAARGLTSDLRLSSYKPLTLAAGTIANTLSKAPLENIKYGFGRGTASRLISIPTPDGNFQGFRIVESQIMTGADAKKYGNIIKTYAGVGVDDPAASIRLDYTPQGFHAQVLTPNGKGAYYIEPLYKGSQSVYASYYSTASLAHAGMVNVPDDVQEMNGLATPTKTTQRTSSNGAATVSLRTYRTAVAATGEYTAAVGGGTVAGGQAAIVTAMQRVSGIYETELGIRLTLVGNNSSLVYTNASTDPYANNTPATLLSQNQTNIDSIIGSGNYDLGHVFSTGGGGLAALGVVGINGNKARGETGLSNPVGDAFYVDYVAHEMGHQFGGNHTFNSSSGSAGGGNRNPNTAYEPGSGSTIMAYAGITGANSDLQSNSDPFFAWKSIDEILTHVDVTVPSAGTRTITNNVIPTVAGPGNFTIPSNTPFALTATGSDSNGNAIYYSWEEADLGVSTTLATADNGSSPLFRVYNPTINPTRLFPQLSSILDGTNSTPSPSGGLSERLPTTSRTMKFVVTARDQVPGAGGTNALSGTTTNVTSVAAASGFGISNFNTSTSIAGNSSQTLTWNVAGTTANGINTANVQILMSTDGGNTFPTVLASSTANDGSESIVIPNTATTTARFKVAAVGNIYFDINNANVTVTASASPSATPTGVDLAGSSDTGSSNTDNLTNLDNSTAAKSLIFVVSGVVSGAAVSLYSGPTVIGTGTASAGLLTITTNGTIDLADGVRNITARQTEPGKTESTNSPALNVTIDTVAPAVLTKALTFTSNKPRVEFVLDSNLSIGNPIPTVVRNSPSPGNVTYNEFLSGTGNIANFGFDSSPNGILPNGDYTITLPADTYRDAAGNSTAATTLNFFYLAGDANRDRNVDFNDFLVLQNNFNASNLNYTLGDFNYDGTIDFNDFLILQNNFNTTV